MTHKYFTLHFHLNLGIKTKGEEKILTPRDAFGNATLRKNITLLRIKVNALRGFGTQDAICIQPLAITHVDSI